MEKTMNSAYFHKLTSPELARFVGFGDEAKILQAAAKRKPRKFAKQIVKVFLNKAKTIWVQNVHYYGGENFNLPYHFPAEITHCTSNSAFRRWINRSPMPNVFTRAASTY
jgi:hypothetical protein